MHGPPRITTNERRPLTSLGLHLSSPPLIYSMSWYQTASSSSSSAFITTAPFTPCSALISATQHHHLPPLSRQHCTITYRHHHSNTATLHHHLAPSSRQRCTITSLRYHGSTAPMRQSLGLVQTSRPLRYIPFRLPTPLPPPCLIGFLRPPMAHGLKTGFPSPAP